MEENKIYCRQAYKCGICGTEYEDVLERAKCEIKCVKQKAEEKRQAEEAKKAAEQKLRKEAVTEAIKRAAKLMNDYVKDYGHYEYEGEIVPNVFWPSKIWSFFD